MSRFRTSPILMAAAMSACAIGMLMSADVGGASGSSGGPTEPTGSVASPLPETTPPATPPVAYNTFTDTWYDQMVTAAQRADAGDDMAFPQAELHTVAKMTPNQRNMRTMLTAIHGISNSTDRSLTVADDKARLRNLLLAHADAIVNHGFRSEFKKHFSKINNRHTDVSACSGFFNSIGQALDAAKLANASTLAAV